MTQEVNLSRDTLYEIIEAIDAKKMSVGFISTKFNIPIELVIDIKEGRRFNWLFNRR